MFKKFCGIIIILGIIFTAGITAADQGEPLEKSVLRLHVIANSDDPADQSLKLQVKDEIVKTMRVRLGEAKDAHEARQIAVQEMPEIKQAAEHVIKEQGYDYGVKVYVGQFNFPTKSYGDLVFPQGNYQAVRVVIGEGRGKNWWCVLFPPLCLVSSTDKGLSLSTPREAQVSFKCLELLPKGVKLGHKKLIK